MADDYSPYLSLAMYEEFVLPYQKIVRDAFGSTTGFHSCIGDPKLLRHWRDDLRITVFNGFKPRRGLASLREDYTPVAREMSGRLVLEPDLDGCKVMVASEDDLKRAVEECLEVFGPAKGIKICATLCGGHHVDDMQKMNVIKKTILASAV
jgi:uroporphyrinogen-III decarboxylase